ncbi:MAG TPA: HyaD/HybD family hydrogenase maturation endopeptidase [Thermoanaerobaculia bacterium]|nr:HyaD/HybD family hydrogenase maturation endopeptidase [Thermoanaerobaculia bacterium]HQR66458.1 HyaD/HybD family hydrogenase maturation endopeptidase [Thermoanaerobaculia bacterium]
MTGDRPAEGPRPVLVLGVGNVLLGDEGVGVHAVRRLEEESWPPHVTLLDGGTGGFHLLSLFQEYDRIVLIDATMDGQPPGTVRVIRPRFASDYPKTLSAHDIGLKDLVESAALLGHAPDVVLIVVSVKTLPEGLLMEMTPDVAASLPRVAELVRRELTP